MALPAGQLHPAFADIGMISVRKLANKAVRICHGCSTAHYIHADLPVETISEVTGNCAGEQRAFLGDIADQLAP
ncbi:hypothetical protein D3C81_1902090 [compost metagenome]